ncbi:tyrosine-type recombinase/integrase [Piscinibacter defluvii]|uniref:tyrosine-type recombinase/integrase n=1 Tax=Piscinibacter defluvii TaxID=1796922 RepID=UPI000FDF4876|nr:tyrosine-type recombinase/integrase [Piscinibacter defluvii]
MLRDLDCRNAKCPDGKSRLRLADAQGLYLEVLPNGGRYWRLKYRHGGVERRLALGVYPEVSLAQARQARDAARETLRHGVDPLAARREAKAAARVARATNFEAVAREWHSAWKAARTDHHAAYVLRRLEADVFPAIGGKPVSEITAPQLVAMAKRIESRGALDIARRALQTCSQVLRYAVAHGLAERNPAADIRPADVLTSRRRENYARIEPKELPELLRKMAVYEGSPYTRLALQLIALTFVRTTELIEAKWSEFDLDAAEWRVPASRMKMRQPHIVPLSTQAVDALRCLLELRNRSEFVFPGERDHERPMSNNTLLKALERLGYKHRMTGHGFRGLASTILHEQGWPHEHIELQLAHQERNKVSAAYNWATYLPERRRMLQAWADHLDALRKGATVLPFKAA